MPELAPLYTAAPPGVDAGGSSGKPATPLLLPTLDVVRAAEAEEEVLRPVSPQSPAAAP